MEKLRCYYAHTTTSYGSTIERKDVELLERLGFEVINPNQEKYALGCAMYAGKYGKDKVIDYFKVIITHDCDMVAFRSLPNGKISSGIAAEIAYARQINLPIIELPCSLDIRFMDYPETKQYLIELGYYKV